MISEFAGTDFVWEDAMDVSEPERAKSIRSSAVIVGGTEVEVTVDVAVVRGLGPGSRHVGSESNLGVV